MRHTFLWAMGLAVCTSLTSCDQIWSARNIPDAVKVKFVESYPTIKRVDWEQRGNQFEAEFKISGRERKALFQEDGTLISYTEEIEEQYLPKTVAAQLQQQFNNYKIEEVHRVQEGNMTSFVVELEKGARDLRLRYNEAGELLDKSAQAPTNAQQQSASLLPLNNTETKVEVLGMADSRWELPAELREVSGISLLPDGTMACVQDEEGKIFIYDLEKKAIIRKIPFAGPGDYEGIAIAGEDAYIVRSDGTLYEIANFKSEKPATKVYEASFPTTINIEGLAYDQEQNQLLLAPKGHDPKLKSEKAIYAFSLDSRKFESEPVVNIALDQVAAPKKGKKQKSHYDVLQPSSLEKHPSDDKLYLLDAVNNRLYSMTEDGKLTRTLDLDKSQLRQAEGLTFDQDGAMYIASEGGKKGKGVILKYARGIN